jgi:hypothetical protein
MSQLAPTIAQLRRSGLQLRVVSGRLKVEPPELISAEADDWLKAHAREVKAFLEAEDKPGMPGPNTTPTPDVFFDLLAPRLNEGELRIMLYLIRRTYGFKKDADRVSITQFCAGIVQKDGTRLDWGTGMARKSVVRSLQSLCEKGLIVAEKGDTETHGHAVNCYRIVLREGGV